MKKSVSLIVGMFVFVFCQTPVFFVAVATAESESTSLSSTTPTLPGCADGIGFSILNGLPCSDGDFTSALSQTAVAPETTEKPALPAGCATSYGFSLYTGQPCASKADAGPLFVPGAGVYLGGWRGWDNPTKATASVKIYFTRPLDIGSRGDDVRLLQFFMAKDKTLYPEGYVNGYFGMNTARAVGRLQLQYGLVRSTSESTYGFVGPRTRALLNSLQ